MEPMIAILISSSLSFVGAVFSGLVLWNFRSLHQRIDKVEQEQKDLTQRMSTCKIDCDRSMVSKEDWVREQAYSRRKMDDMTASLHHLDAKLAIVQQLPEICGQIGRQFALNMKEQHIDG